MRNGSVQGWSNVTRWSPLSRLALVLVVAVLLPVALAYYLQDNTTHELLGTEVLVLILAHVSLNRRWFGTLPGKWKTWRGRIDVLLTGAFAITVLALLVTSLLISRTVFEGMRLENDNLARQVHASAAYWVMLLAAIHIGFRWQKVLHMTKSMLKIADFSRPQILVMRLTVLALIAQGISSVPRLDIYPKLAFQMSLEWWDFGASTGGFFLAWLSLTTLMAATIHYGLVGTRSKTDKIAREEVS